MHQNINKPSKCKIQTFILHCNLKKSLLKLGKRTSFLFTHAKLAIFDYAAAILNYDNTFRRTEQSLLSVAFAKKPHVFSLSIFKALFTLHFIGLLSIYIVICRVIFISLPHNVLISKFSRQWTLFFIRTM